MSAFRGLTLAVLLGSAAWLGVALACQRLVGRS